MKLTTFIFLIFSIVLFGQDILPNLNLSNSIDFKNDSEGNDVKNLLKLKNDEIAVSFYTNGGLGYHLKIDNFIFNENGKVKHYKEEIYYKRGKKFKKRNVKLSELQKNQFKNIIQSEFFLTFSKFDQNDFAVIGGHDFSCDNNYIDDAPENFIIITQNKKSKTIKVYLPKNKLKCAKKDSPLVKFVELHKLFNIKIDKY